MNKNLLIGTVMLPMAFAVSSANADQISDRVQQLERELAELKASLKKEEETPGVTIKKGTTFNYGGFIKVDALWTDNDSGDRSLAGLGDEIYVPSLVPVGGEDGDTYLDTHVKTSRLWFKTATQTDVGVIRSHIETDFLTAEGDERISNSSHSRLRHAYLAWDYEPGSSLLVGQTWSTFFNVGALPEAVDFIGPTAGAIFARQNQIRWTTKMGNGSLMLAMENPSTSLYDGGSGVSGNNYDNNTMPDVIVRYNGSAGDFSYSAAGMVREIAYEEGLLDDETYGYGVSFSGKWMLGKNDLKFMLSHGNLGRYIALNAFRDGAIEADGDIDLIEQTGGFVAYRHWWNEQWRSTFSYAMTTSDNPDTVAIDTNETVSNASVNLIYSPTQSLSFGGEYIYADREVESGDEGKMSRLQFMAKWAF